MTEYKQLEILYNQFSNLTDEIQILIKNGEYNELMRKLEHKSKLLDKLYLTKKTVIFTDDEMKKSKLMEQNLRDKDELNISLIEKLKTELGVELNATNKQVMVNSAYTIVADDNKGTVFDITE